MSNLKDKVEVFVDGKKKFSCALSTLDDRLGSLIDEYKKIGYKEIYSMLGGSNGYKLIACSSKQDAIYISWKNYTGYKDKFGNKIYYYDEVVILDNEGNETEQTSRVYSEWNSKGGLGMYLRVYKPNSNKSKEIKIINETMFMSLKKKRDIFETFE